MQGNLICGEPAFISVDINAKKRNFEIRIAGIRGSLNCLMHKAGKTAVLGLLASNFLLGNRVRNSKVILTGQVVSVV